MTQSILEHGVTHVSRSREYSKDGQKYLKAVEVVAVRLDTKPEEEIVQYR